MKLIPAIPGEIHIIQSQNENRGFPCHQDIPEIIFDVLGGCLLPNDQPYLKKQRRPRPFAADTPSISSHMASNNNRSGRSISKPSWPTCRPIHRSGGSTLEPIDSPGSRRGRPRYRYDAWSSSDYPSGPPVFEIDSGCIPFQGMANVFHYWSQRNI